MSWLTHNATDVALVLLAHWIGLDIQYCGEKRIRTLQQEGNFRGKGLSQHVAGSQWPVHRPYRLVEPLGVRD